jgi:hypothetical protein
MNFVVRFMRISWSEKKYFFEALCYLYGAKILLLVCSFKRIVKMLPRKGSIIYEPEEKLLLSIKNAIARANRFAFWKNECLVKSVAARWMLNRRNISSRLSLGVKHDENGRPIAHAWIKVAQFEVINNDLDYPELTCFE